MFSSHAHVMKGFSVDGNVVIFIFSVGLRMFIWEFAWFADGHARIFVLPSGSPMVTGDFCPLCRWSCRKDLVCFSTTFFFPWPQQHWTIISRSEMRLCAESLSTTVPVRNFVIRGSIIVKYSHFMMMWLSKNIEKRSRCLLGMLRIPGVARGYVGTVSRFSSKFGIIRTILKYSCWWRCYYSGPRGLTWFT